MAPATIQEHTEEVSNGHKNGNGALVTSKKGATTSANSSWHFETLQLHAGLDHDDAHGQCTLGIYPTASFKFKSSKNIENAYDFDDGPRSKYYMYSRLSNPTNIGFERRMAALEGGKEALGFASGAAAILTVAQSLATAGDNAVVSCAVHGGTIHQFEVILRGMGLEGRIVDTNDLALVESLVDEKTKFIFTETIGNPKFAVADLDGLSAIARKANIPLVCDATFTCAGYFCQPAQFGVDIVIHSATKWIGGHGTTLGGVVIETGVSDWQSNAARFPHLHEKRENRSGPVPSLYEQHGGGAYMTFLRWEFMRDTGACLSPHAAQQLFIGVETLSLRCERQARNAETLALWLRDHPRVSYVRFLGLPDHPYHELGRKYLKNGFGTVMTFGIKGGVQQAWDVIDNLQLILNTPNVGDSKTTIGHHWSTTHKTRKIEENHAMGVYEDLLRLSVGIENVQDLIADLDQAFKAVPAK
ncbi:lyase [Xylariomycetidae sp. FL2044]|nr:lyase [Xylariomycetidae sp. FL2044]